MVNFCWVANCLNRSRNRPDPFSVFLRKGTLEGYGKTSVDVVIPNSKIKKTLGFAAHTSRLHPSKSRLAGEKKLSQVNYRNILIPRLIHVMFLPVKRDWRIERDVLLMKNVLNLKREALPKKTFVS